MTSPQKLRYLAVCAAVSLAFAAAVPARAQDEGDTTSGLLPAESAFSVDASFPADEETHPPLRLTPERSEILTADEDIQRVIIGNDTNINVLLDTPRRVIVVPRAPGATHFTLLGAGGKVIMQRYAIVASPKEKYIRIRQTCLQDSNACQPVRMYYCPGMCHEVAIQDGNASASGGPSSVSGGGGSQEADNGDAPPAPEL